MRVTAPASTANLGPGFDCLGAALSCGLSVTEGPDTDNLVSRAAREITGTEVGVEIASEIPVSAGLGSSAACIAAGLMLGCAMSGRQPDPDELLRVGTAIEGHPDNLAAALRGGITLALPNGDVMRFEPAEAVRPMILVSDAELPTEQARRALPEDVPRADAVANVARSSGLLAILTGAAPATRRTLLECTEDRLHQPYRMELMPGTARLVGAARDAGIAAAVSGAGPSVVCLVLRGEEEGVRELAAGAEGWRVLEVDWEPRGARIG